MPRFNQRKYTPGADSSDGFKQKANDSGHVILVVNRREDGTEGCPCGCGRTDIGPKSKFAMGHDARLRGKLIRAHLTGTQIVMSGEAQPSPVLTAMDIAGRFAWQQYLQDAVARRDGKNRQVVQKAMGSKRLVKVGRWEYTGQVVAIYEIPGNGEDYDIEYVTKLGDVKRTRVPANKTREVK